ncbi:MAG: M48 family metallopeptidase [Burkholderiaceae bacterium]|nr:M48 family metallopeptidase [Burkholderiaceae bacterium]
MQDSTFTLLFAAALLASLAAKFWLATRQMRHVAAHRDQVPAAFAATVTLDAHRRGADYTLAKGRFGLIATAFGTLLLLGWTLLGGLDALNQALVGTVQPRFGNLAYQLALLAAFALIGSALDLPFELYSTFRIEQRFGFNRMTPRLFIADLLKNAAVGALIGLPLAVIAPLFNKFEPLADVALKERVQALMQRCGFAAKGLFVMDGSRRSAHANAYFTGLGASKRVVFFDTLLQRLSPGEVEAVLAHELGHFSHRHVQKRMAGIFGFSLLALALLGWLSTLAPFYEGLGVTPNLGVPNDALALLLFMLALPPFAFFVSPMLAHFSRRHEFEADAYACAQASGQDLANALLKLHEDNAATLTPDPVYVRFYYSHPPASERLAALALAER